MTIYIEAVFLDNFLPDTFILFFCTILQKKPRLIRAVFGGAAGGIYAVFSAYFPILSAFYLKLPAALLMCLICFGKGKAWIRGCLSFFALSFLLGGISFGLLYCLPARSFRFSWRMMLLAGIILLTIVTLLQKNRPREFAETLSIELTCCGTILLFSAEYDSGTEIFDEYGRGVILVDRDFLKKNLSAAQWEALHSRTEQTRTFHIRTAAGSTALTGFLPERLTVSRNTQTLTVNAYIIIADHIHLNGSPAIYGRGLETEES